MVLGMHTQPGPASAPERPAAGPALHEGRLLLEDPERLLEPRDLCLAAGLPLLVRLRLGDAPVLELLVVVQDGAEFSVRRLPVGSHLGDGLVQRGELLRLVLHILLLHSLGYLV